MTSATLDLLRCLARVLRAAADEADASAERLTVEALEAVLAVAVPDEETG